MIHKIFFCLLLLMFLIACATEDKYYSKLNSLVGKNESDVLSHFGKPSAQKILPDGQKILTYTKVQNMFVPAEMYEYNIQPFVGANDIYYPFSQRYIYNPLENYLGEEVTLECKTSFLLKNNIVQNWSTIGNDCVAY